MSVTEANDLAEKNPEKLKELIALWEVEAKKYNVLPLGDRRYERVADPTRPVASIPMKQYTSWHW
jgi:arylsulfatase